MNKFRINLTEGAGYNGPYINKFSSGFDSIEFYVDKSFPKDCTYAVIYSVCGDVGMSTDKDANVSVSVDSDTGKTLVNWTVGREVTCDSGVVIYQVVVYTADETGNDTAVWYSPQGRIVVGDSIDTTDYETASIAAEPSLVAQLISKMNTLSKDSVDHLRRIDILEQLQQSIEHRIDEMYGEFSRDIESAGVSIAELNNGLGTLTDGLDDAVENISENGVKIATITEDLGNIDEAFSAHNDNMSIHLSSSERNKAEQFFDLYDANGLLSLTSQEAEETNRLLSDVVAVPSNLRIAFMNGAHSVDAAPYNKLKLLSSYGICDYIFNGGGFAPEGENLSVSEALEILKAAGKGILTVRGDSMPDATVWGNVFCGGDKSYYYIDDPKKHIRIVVLDTTNMDNAQLHWFVKDALRPGIDGPVIVFSHRNLADFILKSSGNLLFKEVFRFAQEGGTLTIADEIIFNDSAICRVDVSTKFDASVEIIAAVHGDCGIDSCKSDLSKNFFNLGVAEDLPKGEARSLFEQCDVNIHSDVSKVSELKSVVRANASDVTSGGRSAIEIKPTTSDNEVYIVPDIYDISNVDGYVVIETNIRPDKNISDNGMFVITTNQSRLISKSVYFGDLAEKADDDGWIRFTVVICKKTNSPYYGMYNTYINGVSHSGWHNGYLGELMDSGIPRTEIRLVAKGLTTESVLHFGRNRVYVAPAMPSEMLLKAGLADDTFCYGGELYNSGYEQELLHKLGGDKGCYDVLCIDTELQKIKCCRFGYGDSRSLDWVVPEPVFE